jgi:hypothetical protein
MQGCSESRGSLDVAVALIFFFLGRSPRQDNSDGQREIDYISIGHELLNCVLNVTEWLNVVYIGQLNTLA